MTDMVREFEEFALSKHENIDKDLRFDWIVYKNIITHRMWVTWQAARTFGALEPVCKCGVALSRHNIMEDGHTFSEWHEEKETPSAKEEKFNELRNLQADTGNYRSSVVLRDLQESTVKGETPSALSAFDWRVSQGIPDTRKYSGTELDKLLDAFAAKRLREHK